MNISSTIIDFYDDNGVLLREAVEKGSIPEFVKSAEVITNASSNEYALILVESGNTFKKYASADVGNTWLSAIYFHLTHDRLPKEAQKIAASNLSQACEHYGLPVSNLMEELRTEKVNGNVFDLEGQSLPTKVAFEREPINYAIERLDGSKKFPLDNAESIAAASKYFSLNHGQFQPRERREFSIKVASVSDPYGFPLCESILQYSGEKYGQSIKGHLFSRKKWLQDFTEDTEVMEAFEKVSSLLYKVSPDQFAANLEDFDRAHGIDRVWDKYIADPYLSTFGISKEAKGKETLEVLTVGEESLTNEDLERLSKDIVGLRNHFGEDFSNKFVKNPVVMFKSMPLPQRKLIARMSLEARGYYG